MKAIAHLLLSGLAVFVAARVLPGVSVSSYGDAVVVAVVLGLVNALLRPVLLILTLPINILTLGLFTFVVIGGCVLLVAQVVPGFHVVSLAWALAFAFTLWLINAFFHLLEK